MMIVSVLILPCGWICAAENQVINLERRQDLALVFYSPTRKVATGTARLFAGHVDRVLRTYTDLQVVDIDDPTIGRCVEGEGRGPLACFVEAAVPAYNIAHLRRRDGGAKTWREVRHGQLQDGTFARFLLVLSVSEIEAGQDQVTAFLVDTLLALRSIHEARLRAPDNPDLWAQVEDQIAEHAVVARPEPAVVADEDAVKTYIARIFEQDFLPPLRDAGHWAVYGDVVLEALSLGTEIELDQRPVGAARGGTVQLRGVRQGRRLLRLKRAGYHDFERVLDVSKGDRSVVRAHFQPLPKTSTLRKTLFWGGLGLVAVGAGVLSYGVFRSGPTRVCLGSSGDCSSAPFTRFGGASPGPVGTGLPAAPLGYSTMGMGAAFTLGSHFLGEPEDPPWIALAAGVATFGLSLGLSMALNPR